MRGLFAIAITTFLAVVVYACRPAIYSIYDTSHLTPGKFISLFFVVDAILIAVIFIGVTMTARLTHWLLNRNQEVAEIEVDPSEECVEAYD